ncbi:MAG: hypothetical protein ABMA64_17385 [Myxococcota bacterium]
MWWLALACSPDPSGGDPCAAAPASPGSIDEAVELFDALPRPLTVACVVASLERPLGVEITTGRFSAQPAYSDRSPRVFLMLPGLTLSVVPEGPGAPLLEFGEPLSTDPDGPGAHTVKGELLFPIFDGIGAEDPFDRVSAGAPDRSVCGTCHYDEVSVGDGRYASAPYRPVDETIVSVATLAGERDACDPALEPDRCAMLAALFDHGEVVREPFPEGYGTIYEP